MKRSTCVGIVAMVLGISAAVWAAEKPQTRTESGSKVVESSCACNPSLDGVPMVRIVARDGTPSPNMPASGHLFQNSKCINYVGVGWACYYTPFAYCNLFFDEGEMWCYGS